MLFLLWRGCWTLEPALIGKALRVWKSAPAWFAVQSAASEVHFYVSLEVFCQSTAYLTAKQSTIVANHSLPHPLLTGLESKRCLLLRSDLASPLDHGQH